LAIIKALLILGQAHGMSVVDLAKLYRCLMFDVFRAYLTVVMKLIHFEITVVILLSCSVRTQVGFEVKYQFW